MTRNADEAFVDTLRTARVAQPGPAVAERLFDSGPSVRRLWPTWVSVAAMIAIVAVLSVRPTGSRLPTIRLEGHVWRGPDDVPLRQRRVALNRWFPERREAERSER